MSEHAIRWLDPEQSKAEFTANGELTTLKVYSKWDDAHALQRAKRAGVDLATVIRVVLLVRGIGGGGYLVRAHAAQSQYGTWLGFSLRRDSKMQMSRSGSPSGYEFGRDMFLPPEPDRAFTSPTQENHDGVAHQA